MTPTTSSAQAEMIMKPPNSVVTWLCIEIMSINIMNKTGDKVLLKKRNFPHVRERVQKMLALPFFYLIFL